MLLNPGRGFYHHIESNSSSPTPLDLDDLKKIRSEGRTILLREYYLDSFLDTDIVTLTFLDLLAADFETMLAS